MFDTHCHLNFEVFKKNIDDVIKRAIDQGIIHILVPATDVLSSRKALFIANRYKNIYASVGIHPHHVFQFQYENKENFNIEKELKEVEELIKEKKVEYKAFK